MSADNYRLSFLVLLVLGGLFCAGAPAVTQSSKIEKKKQPILHKLILPWEKRDKEKWLSFGLGPTLASFDQTDLSYVSQTNITLSMDLRRDIIPREWLIAGNAYLSAISMPRTAVAAEGMKYLGADAYIGYELPFSGYAWPIHLNLGFFGTTSFGTDQIGYGNVVGPELFPSLRFLFADGSTLFLHGKVAPIFSGFSILSLESNYMALSAKYYFPRFRVGFLKSFPLGVSLDASRLRLKIKNGLAEVMTYTLGLNVMFQ